MEFFKINQTQLIEGITDIVMIPNGFDVIVDKLLEKEGFSKYKVNSRGKVTTTLNSKTLVHKERLLLLIGTISSKLKYLTRKFYIDSTSSPKGSERQDDVYAPIEMFLHFRNDIMDSMLLKNNTQCEELFQILLKYEVLSVSKDEVSFIDWDLKSSGEYISKKPRAYICSEQFNRYFKPYKITSTKIIDELKKKRSAKYMERLSSDEYRKLLIDIPERYEFPTIESIEAKAKEMVASGVKSKDGQTYVWEYSESDFGYVTKKFKVKNTIYTRTIQVKTNDSVVSIQEGIDIYKRFINEGLYFKDKGEATRYYTSFSLMPSWIRKYIKIDGKKLIENDFTALHSRLINKFIGCDIEELTGDSHTKLMNKLELSSRNEAKIIGLSYWNSMILNGQTVASKKNANAFKRMDEWLKREHITFWKKLNEIKGVTHTSMSKLLMRLERFLMDDVVEQFVGDLPYIYCYDCIYTTIDIKDEMEGLIK